MIMQKAMQKILFPTLLVFIFFQTVTGQNNENYAEEIAIFEQFVLEQMPNDNIPGLSVGFIKDDFIWSRGFGYADLENKCPAKAESAYRLASVTKPMTATAVLKLVEQGKIDLDAEVQTYVPYFPKKPWPVTVRQLLGHLGGVSHYQNYDEEGHFKEPYDTRRAISVFENFDLVAEPETEYHYTSYGYNLLGAVIESAADTSYGYYMTEHIWQPLGMHDTRLDDPVALIPNRVRGYRLLDGEVKNSEFVDISSRFAAGGTRSTVIDMLRFGEGMMTGDILSDETTELMWTSMSTRDSHFTNYGMGWGLTPVNGRFQVRHSGGQPETSTLLVLFPEEKFVMAIAANLEGANTRNYLERLYELVLDEPWGIQVYTGSKTDDAIYAAMNAVFNYGLSYFERNGADLTKDIHSAFAYFNQNVDRKMLQTNFEEASEKIEDGRHPVAGQAFVKLGGYMASQLNERFDEKRLATYHASGPLAFFSDYIDLYKNNSGNSDSVQFKVDFEKQVRQWNKDWQQTWNEYTQNLVITADSDFDVLADKLQKTFANANVYPDFVDEFADISKQYFMQGDRQKAYESAQVARELYPNSEEPNVILAVLEVVQGNKKAARGFVKRVMEINPRSGAISGNLNQTAYQLAAIGMEDSALELLKIAAQVNPKEANLYDSIGELYLGKGQTQEAISYYKKALEVDPDFENAKRMLERITSEE